MLGYWAKQKADTFGELIVLGAHIPVVLFTWHTKTWGLGESNNAPLVRFPKKELCGVTEDEYKQRHKPYL
jgi:hypothetical protein